MRVHTASYEEHTKDGDLITYSLAKIGLDDGNSIVVRGDGVVGLYNAAGDLINTVTSLFPEEGPKKEITT